MSRVEYEKLPQTQASLEHILKHYKKYQGKGPMMVGVSGCQGSGKTTLCDTLTGLLKQHDLRVVNFSMDDVYLTRQEQIELSNKYPNNPLYQQRGQAGSHDLNLTFQTFELLHKNKGVISIPVYDKSLHEGKGDRLDKSQWKQAITPIDIVLFEGWMLGFKPIVKPIKKDMLVGCSVEDAMVMNGYLKEYQDMIYPFLDIFIHLSPEKLEQVYEWRLQQEHFMKETRGVNGLTDAQVKSFVDTYMTAYKLYLPRLDKVGFFGKGEEGESLKDFEGLNRKDGGYSQPNRHLRIVLNKNRNVIESRTIYEISNTISLKRRNILYPLVFITALGLFSWKRKFIYQTWQAIIKK